MEPKKSAARTAYWTSVEGDNITFSNQTRGKLSLRPKYLSGLVNISARMLTSNPGVEDIVRMDLIDVLAQESDRMFIQGSGTGSQLTGITNTTAVLTDT